ncbi:MAG TPA: 50S ribosomal protein L18 [Vicinamibacteria bacterium]|nr:50S ribosomal protein L18 [Vicinamibacteria bacterium]
MRVRTKEDYRRRIKYRIRSKVFGTAERPRLCVYRSLKHIYAQVVDDSAGRTLVSASSLEKDFPAKQGKNRQAATELGTLIARRSIDKGIERVVFDRNGFKYHGRVKTLAEAAREGGLKF